MTNRLRVLIVDDEPLARQRIRDLLEEEPDVQIIGECSDGEQAVEQILRHRPDLVFLDVQMPEMNGFDVLEAVGVRAMPAVIFVTAFDEYALRAFDAHALDYLMKPFHRDRFRAALQRASEQLQARRESAGEDPVEQRLRAVLAELERRHRSQKRLVVRLGGRILFISPADVDWIDADGNYARLHVGPRSYLLRETMSRLAEQLDAEQFIRIHRSTIVNLDRIQEIQPLFKGNYVVILRDGTKLTSTRGYRQNLQALIGGEV